MWRGFTLGFLDATRSVRQRPAYGLPRAGRARNLYRGAVACIVTDLGIIGIGGRLVSGSCPVWLLALYLLRFGNPLLSIGLHCYDMKLLPIPAAEEHVYAIDCSWIAVATITDLLYCSWALGHTAVITNDVLALFSFAVICVSTRRQPVPAIGLGLFLLRAVYLGLVHTDGPVWICCALAAVGCLLNLVDEAIPMSHAALFSVYDVVHACWFANFILMLWLGDAQTAS